jgi:eukaryotic-like serine/threonine-protein kinase
MRLEGLQFDQYRPVRLLKKGGMGEVYLAEDAKLNRRVAMKVIHTDIVNYADDEEAREAMRLFLREAQVVAKLDHPNILPLYDAGEKYVEGITLMYMVMPLREEGSLADWLRRYHSGATLSPRIVERIMRQAASALQYAHERNIIHQDVKPSNFLIRDTVQHPGQLYLQLADFGVAKLTTTTTSHSQIIRGTPTHMAPEQWEGQAVPASDQYALAVMVYELLTGQPPFEGGNHQQMWYQHSYVKPPPPSSLNPQLPDSLDSVLLRALAKTPRERYSSISAFALAFRQALLETGNIQQQLVINETEAHRGTSRTIHVAGRRHLTVDIPPGVYDGQILRFEGQGVLPVQGGQPGALLLTIIIAHSQRAMRLADTNPLPQTVIATEYDNREQPVPRPLKNGPNAKIVLLLCLALLLIVAGIGAIGLSLLHASDNTNPSLSAFHSTGTTQTIGTTPNLTASAQTNATANAQSSATATAQTNATATAIAERNATSTAQTATAVAQTTATVEGYNALESGGTPVITDPLQDNTRGYNWDINYVTGTGGCRFFDGAYQSSVPQPGLFSSCYAHTSNYSNIFYEIQLRISRGDQGGILFRYDQTTNSFYYFHIDTSGKYALDLYQNDILSKTLVSGTSSIIDTTPGNINLIAVQANGSALTLFVNRFPVNSTTNSMLSQGQIGVMAYAITNPTDVSFSNAKVSTI